MRRPWSTRGCCAILWQWCSLDSWYRVCIHETQSFRKNTMSPSSMSNFDPKDRVSARCDTCDTHSGKPLWQPEILSYRPPVSVSLCSLCSLSFWQLTCAQYFQRSTSVLMLSHKLEVCSCGIASQWIRYPIRTKIEETRYLNRGILLLYSITIKHPDI
jgi:hypothetical protein